MLLFPLYIVKTWKLSSYKLFPFKKLPFKRENDIEGLSCRMHRLIGVWITSIHTLTAQISGVKAAPFCQWSPPWWDNLCHSADVAERTLVAARSGTSRYWLSSESQNHLHFKTALGSMNPTINLTLPSSPRPHHVPKCHIYISFKYFQGWWLNHLPGEVPVCPDPSAERDF